VVVRVAGAGACTGPGRRCSADSPPSAPPPFDSKPLAMPPFTLEEFQRLTARRDVPSLPWKLGDGRKDTIGCMPCNRPGVADGVGGGSGKGAARDGAVSHQHTWPEVTIYMGRCYR
jgi:hypothetical protein